MHVVDIYNTVVQQRSVTPPAMGLIVCQDSAGRFCLNDAHRVSGSEDRHNPGYWSENKQPVAIIDKIQAETDTGIPVSPISKVKSGKWKGTWACWELVNHYAMWESPGLLPPQAERHAVARTRGGITGYDSFVLSVSPPFQAVALDLCVPLRCTIYQRKLRFGWRIDCARSCARGSAHTCVVANFFLGKTGPKGFVSAKQSFGRPFPTLPQPFRNPFDTHLEPLGNRRIGRAKWIMLLRMRAIRPGYAGRRVR